MKYWLAKAEEDIYDWRELSGKDWDIYKGTQKSGYPKKPDNMYIGDSVYYYHNDKKRKAAGLAQMVSRSFVFPTGQVGWGGFAVSIEAEYLFPKSVNVDDKKALKKPLLMLQAISYATFQRRDRNKLNIGLS